MKNYIALSIVFILLAFSSISTSWALDLAKVDDEIKKINLQAQEANYPLIALTRDHFDIAIRNGRKYFFPKNLRRDLDLAVNDGLLSSRSKLEIQAFPEENIYRVDYVVQINPHSASPISLVEGLDFYLENPEVRAGCDSHPSLCTEPEFFSSFLTPQSQVPTFPYVVQKKELRFTPAQIQERPETANFSQIGLQIFISVSRQNIQQVVEYFGFGQDSQKMKSILEKKLGSAAQVEVDLRHIMPLAVQISLDRFPTTSHGEFDVCYNAASTFYNSSHKQGNNSTELLQSILNRYYCPRNNLSDLRFGDILYSGGHAVRYIMFDANAGRHVVYQMNSGGFEAWRFIYLDEAFRYSGDPEVPFREFYDAYSRCR